MMVMTAKLNLKKILLILGVAAAGILALVLLMGGNSQSGQAPVSGNEARVKFLRDLGWEIPDSPSQSNQVKIPKETSQLYERYNNLQKSQGYDLSRYAGKKVMRYVYPVSNYPGATAPVYATLLVLEDKIIGGDITDTAAGGKIRGLQKVLPPMKPQASSLEADPPAGETAAPTLETEAPTQGLPQ